MPFVAVCKAVSCRKSEGKRCWISCAIKKRKRPSEWSPKKGEILSCLECMSSRLQEGCLPWGWPRMCSARSQAELSQCSPGTAVVPCIPCNPRGDRLSSADAHLARQWSPAVPECTSPGPPTASVSASGTWEQASALPFNDKACHYVLLNWLCFHQVFSRRAIWSCSVIIVVCSMQISVGSW